MRALSVLFTNNALGPRAGSETYVRDVALALLRRGHRPVAFSLVLGEVADELRRATIPVIDDLARLASPPDVIHGHHHIETLIAALMFPGTPIVHFCHGWLPWEEMPLHHPDIRRYVAVDEVCFDRLVREEGISPDQVDVLRNFVDLDRFGSRAPLPARPSRALVLSNYATDDGYTRIIGAACHAAGISLEIVGTGMGNASAAPERLLPAFDLVFAKGRTALEALVVGCAVVVADAAGAGPLVTPDNFDTLRSRNFGIRALHRAHDAAWYGSQIAEYSSAAAAEVCARVRAEAGMDIAVDRLLAIYAAAMAAPPATGDRSRAAAVHISRIARSLKEALACSSRIHALTAALDLTRHERDAQAAAIERERTWAGESIRALETQVAAFHALPTLRIRDAVLRAPVVGRMLRAAARGLGARL